MKETHQFLAFDLGAESGRAILATLQHQRIELQEIHRFRTEGLIMLGQRQWDLARIYEEMVEGLTICARDFTSDLDGIACDTWGVDFGLIAEDGTLLGNPVHYRDKRTEGMHDYAFTMVPREEIYKETGIQFLPFNTVYQLLALRKSGSPLLKVADSMLLMGDLLGYLLSGQKACEYTNASTTQMLDPHKRTWNKDLIKRLNLPEHLLPELTPPGTVLGPILPELAQRTGINPKTPIIAPGTHDTASAVAAVPVAPDAPDWAYLSSGTWSLLGAELDEPVINDLSYKYQFTNEGGVDNKIRFLKNISGLWLVQECRRIWQREGQEVDYATLTAEAKESTPFASVIDASDPRVLAPDNMVELLREMSRESGQQVPESRGAVVRCALESLALDYRKTVERLNHTLGKEIKVLHIIGGGTQNKLLSQMTADACKIPVITGPVEATVLGNVGVQAMAAGALGSLEDVRKVIRNSFNVEEFTPRNSDQWDRIAAAHTG